MATKKNITVMPTKHRVRLDIEVDVYAMDRIEAIDFAKELVSESVRVLGTKVQRDWKPQAEALLDSGMSLREAARTLNVDPGNMARQFAGRGWTPAQGGAYGQLQTQLNNLPDHLPTQEREGGAQKY